MERWNARRGLLYSTTTAIVCSVVETLQIPLDDNLTICLAGGTFLRGLSLARWPSNWAWDEWITGLLVSAGTGLAALSLKTLTLSGLVCGVVMGSVVYSSFGAQGFLLLATFFVLGSLFSKIGYRRKQLEGTAQPDFGRSSASFWGGTRYYSHRWNMCREGPREQCLSPEVPWGSWQPQ